MNNTERRILLGRVVGAFGLRGELKIESWTEPRISIFRYQPWILKLSNGQEKTLSGVRGREMGKNIIANFPDVLDRTAAEACFGAEISVLRSSLPPPKPDEYYWVDLEGLEVRNLEGVILGNVSHLFSTGANDVVVITGDRERMVPFVFPDYVQSVDFESRLIIVDWDPDF